MCIRREPQEKAWWSLSFSPVSKPHTHITYMLRQCTSIVYFRPPYHVISMELLAVNFRCQCTQQKLQSICAVLTFDPQLSKNLNIFCKRQISITLSYLYQRYEYRDNYFFKIEFVFFLYLLLSVSWNENDLPLYISDIRNILGYRTSVFIQPFPWCLHITYTYNLTHVQLWNADVVTVIV